MAKPHPTTTQPNPGRCGRVPAPGGLQKELPSRWRGCAAWRAAGTELPQALPERRGLLLQKAVQLPHMRIKMANKQAGLNLTLTLALTLTLTQP